VSKLSWQKISPTIVKICWGLLFFTLPVTSFPFFPSDIGGKTMVRPLAIYPLILLFILFTIPILFKRPAPKTFLPIFAFVVVAIISSIISLSSDLDALRGITVTSRLVRNISTLGLGIAFYLTVTLLPKTWDDMRFSLRWLYAGFALALLWGTLQIIYVINFSSPYFKLLGSLQSFVSTRKLFPTRISGFTYEPKWFAEQLCFLLIPWLLGAILTQRSIFTWRYRGISVELILLGWASIVLVFTYSRTGLFILSVLIVLSFFIYRSQTLTKPGGGSKSPRSKRKRILETSILVIVILLVIYILGAQNPYFSRLWRYWTEAKKRNRPYLEYIAIQQRFVYWQTAYNTFEAYPLLGVGLGNYAFYFDEMLPNQPWDRQKEIMRQITPTEGRDRLITPKNLYARLLAETGIIGTAIFTTFVIAILGCVLFLGFSNAPEERYWAISSVLAMIVFLIVVFSFDSFALPNMWVVFGLITAAAHIPESSSSSIQAVALGS